MPERTKKVLTDSMRAALVRMAALTDDTALEHTWSAGWRFVRTVTPGTSRAWPQREWIGYVQWGTMEALQRRGLVEVRYPRLTPGLHATTAFLTDAGRAAIATPDEAVADVSR